MGPIDHDSQLGPLDDGPHHLETARPEREFEATLITPKLRAQYAQRCRCQRAASLYATESWARWSTAAMRDWACSTCCTEEMQFLFFFEVFHLVSGQTLDLIKKKDPSKSFSMAFCQQMTGGELNFHNRESQCLKIIFKSLIFYKIVSEFIEFAQFTKIHPNS